MTACELSDAAHIAERYAREWLCHQAASGYLEYDPSSHKFTLTPEQAMVFADTDSPAGRLRSGGRDDGEPSFPRARVQVGQGRGLGRSGLMPVLYGRTVLPPKLSSQSGRVMATGAGGRHRETGTWRESRGRRLRLRLLDDPHGEGVPEIDLRRV
jgi:hypothetical protein